MSIDFKIDYDQVEAMSKQFETSAQEMENLDSALRSIVETLSEGALLGNGGNALYDAILNVLCVKVDKIRAKFEELSSDLKGVISISSGADTQAATRFRD